MGDRPEIRPENGTIAAYLRDMAHLLEQQDADSFRVSAYRHAAQSVDGLGVPLAGILRDSGMPGLVALPHIGKRIGAAIAEMVTTGRWLQLERLTGLLDPETLFQTVPVIGPRLARAIHDTLQIDTLEALEIAAHDGRLETVSGIGPRRADAIRSALSERLGRRLRSARSVDGPSIADVLDVDAEYRRKAAAGSLPLIAPRRFNPSGEAWLPILHTNRAEWSVTALFSNTRNAHAVGKTRDWVILVFQKDDESEISCTVVTETHGPAEGRRVVRGRELDTITHYGG